MRIFGILVCTWMFFVNNSFVWQSSVCVVKGEPESGKIAGIAGAIGVALLGAASSYFAYQKKKLCFKLQGGQYVFVNSHVDLFRMAYKVYKT